MSRIAAHAKSFVRFASVAFGSLGLSIAFGVASPAPVSATSSQWNVTPLTVANSFSSYLTSVDCWSVNNCMAVGSDWNQSGSVPLVETLTNGNWQQTDLPLPNGAQLASLSTISCPSATECMAGGEYWLDNNHQGRLIARFHNGAWTETAITEAQGVTSASVSGIDCSSTTFCAAAGVTSTGQGANKIDYGTWDGASWTWTDDWLPAGAFGADANAVVCPADNDCQIAGDEEHGSNYMASVFHLTTGPLAVTTDLQPNGEDAAVTGISCTSTSSCVAVGTSGGNNNPDVREFNYNGSAWSLSNNISPDLHGYTSISCATTTYCLTAGWIDLSQTTYAAAADEINAGVWSASTAPQPDGTDQNDFEGVSCPSAGNCVAVGSTNDGPLVGILATASQNASGMRGYRMTAADGGVFGYGEAPFHGSAGSLHLNRPIVGIADTPSGNGYWMVASDGGIFSYGDAAFHGSAGSLQLNKPIVGMAPTPTGNGYWLVASDGGIFSYGDAAFHGSAGSLHLNKPIVGMAPTPTGNGYWLVASDGGIFSYGDAAFHGSAGSLHLNAPIVGMARTSSGNGYWMVSSDGGIFSYGDAGFHGSAGSLHLNSPITGIAPTPTNLGYVLVARDGGVFNYGDAPFLGSAGGAHLNQPVVAIAPVNNS